MPRLSRLRGPSRRTAPSPASLLSLPSPLPAAPLLPLTFPCHPSFTGVLSLHPRRCVSAVSRYVVPVSLGAGASLPCHPSSLSSLCRTPPSPLRDSSSPPFFLPVLPPFFLRPSPPLSPTSVFSSRLSPPCHAWRSVPHHGGGICETVAGTSCRICPSGFAPGLSDTFGRGWSQSTQQTCSGGRQDPSRGRTWTYGDQVQASRARGRRWGLLPEGPGGGGGGVSAAFETSSARILRKSVKSLLSLELMFVPKHIFEGIKIRFS